MASVKEQEANAVDGDVVVMKFGGTSVAGPEELKRAAARIVAAREQGSKVVAVLEAMAEVHRRQVRELELVAGKKAEGELACNPETIAEDHPGMPAFVLRFGLDFHRWVVGWCERESESARKAERVAGGAGV